MVSDFTISLYKGLDKLFSSLENHVSAGSNIWMCFNLRIDKYSYLR